MNDLPETYYPGTDSIEEPEEGDFVSDDGGRTWREVGSHKPPFLVVGDGDSAAKLLRRYADRQGFWPHAWLISDHGNAHPFKYHI